MHVDAVLVLCGVHAVLAHARLPMSVDRNVPVDEALAVLAHARAPDGVDPGVPVGDDCVTAKVMQQSPIGPHTVL
eukprot:7022985-Alexandrium_andersonii.AAC.1